jgi:hypothetical protein
MVDPDLSTSISIFCWLVIILFLTSVLRLGAGMISLSANASMGGDIFFERFFGSRETKRVVAMRLDRWYYFAVAFTVPQNQYTAERRAKPPD